MKFWEMKNLANDKGEIQLYGEISETSWWGDEVTPKQFADDLKNLGSVSEIDVRINSMGGDVFAANTIASLLRANKANVNIYIDGIAASAATIIAMAGDTIYIPENGMMMIHDPLIGLAGYYNTKHFESFVEVLEKIKDSIIASYKSKTDKSEEEISDIMSTETWYIGHEAVENGFADQLIELDIDVDIQDNMGDKIVIANKMQFDVSNFKNSPKTTSFGHKNIKNNPENNKPNLKNKKNKEEKEMTLEEFKNEHPDLYKKIKDAGYEEGVDSERKRIKDIEELVPTGYENLARDAKFKDGTTAEVVAMNIVKAQKELGGKFLNETDKDAEELEGVEPSEDGEEEKKNKKKEDEEEVKNSLLKSFVNRRK